MVIKKFNYPGFNNRKTKYFINYSVHIVMNNKSYGTILTAKNNDGNFGWMLKFIQKLMALVHLTAPGCQLMYSIFWVFPKTFHPLFDIPLPDLPHYHQPSFSLFFSSPSNFFVPLFLTPRLPLTFIAACRMLRALGSWFLALIS